MVCVFVNRPTCAGDRCLGSDRDSLVSGGGATGQDKTGEDRSGHERTGEDRRGQERMPMPCRAY